MAKDDVERLQKLLAEKEEELRLKVVLVGEKESLIESLQAHLSTLQGEYDGLVIVHDASLKEIALLEAMNKKLEEAFFERGAGRNAHVEAFVEDPRFTEEEERLIQAACAAYKIDSEHVVKARIEDGAAVVLTVGGARIRYRHGDEGEKGFKPLSQIQVTGINPENEKRKPLVGRGSKQKDE